MSTRRNESTYKWHVLTLAALTHTFAVAVPVMCMPVLFTEISNEMGLSLVQIGEIWGISAFSGIFTGLIGGSIGDRIGIRHTLSAACLLAGITGALRGLSNSPGSLAATVFLFGFLASAIPPNIHKTCGIWFSGKHLGLANGVVSAGMALGFVVGSLVSATVMSPLLGGWRNVLFFYGSISLVISILWRLVQRAPGNIELTTNHSTQSLRQALSHVVSIRNVWVLGLVMLGIGGCLQGMLGYLPLYLREIGWTGVRADGALAAFHGISLIFAIPLAFLSDRFKKRKTVLIAATFMTIVGVASLSAAEGAMIWISVAIAGIVRDGFMAIFMTVVIETKEIGITYAGTAMGMVMVFSRLGGLFSPPIGNSLAAIEGGLPFIFWSALAIVAFLALCSIKE